MPSSYHCHYEVNWRIPCWSVKEKADFLVLLFTGFPRTVWQSQQLCWCNKQGAELPEGWVSRQGHPQSACSTCSITWPGKLLIIHLQFKFSLLLNLMTSVLGGRGDTFAVYFLCSEPVDWVGEGGGGGIHLQFKFSLLLNLMICVLWWADSNPESNSHSEQRAVCGHMLSSQLSLCPAVSGIIAVEKSWCSSQLSTPHLQCWYCVCRSSLFFSCSVSVPPVVLVLVCLSFVFLHVGSPWYNCTGWLGVKHQLTYSPCWPVQRVGFVNYKFNAGQLSDPCQELILHHLLVPFLHMHGWWVYQSVFVRGSGCVTDFHPVHLLDLEKKLDSVNALCK